MTARSHSRARRHAKARKARDRFRTLRKYGKNPPAKNTKETMY